MLALSQCQPIHTNRKIAAIRILGYQWDSHPDPILDHKAVKNHQTSGRIHFYIYDPDDLIWFG